jgi:tryptophanyl-tRNA synthetase
MSEDVDVLSLIQPSGELHLGNYLGAVLNWVHLQERHRCLFGVVDYHAMTVPFDAETLRERTWQMGLDLIACGLDPDRCLLLVQSLVPEHTELAWIFSCITPYAWVAKMTQFKDKSRQVEEAGASISTGLFAYPVLQAADILIYKAHKVPVGQDQDQHLELARDVARAFNRQFGETFPEPKPIHTATPKILSPADPTKKMSKSLGPKHTIGVFEDAASIRRKVKSAVTDTGEPAEGEALSPGVTGLLTLLEAAGRTEEAREFRADYERGQRRYAPLKEAVAEALVELTEPLRERRRELRADRKRVKERLKESSARARDIARRTLAEVRERVGLPPQR